MCVHLQRAIPVGMTVEARRPERALALAKREMPAGWTRTGIIRRLAHQPGQASILKVGGRGTRAPRTACSLTPHASMCHSRHVHQGTHRQSLSASLALYAATMSALRSGVSGHSVDGVTKWLGVRHTGHVRSACRGEDMAQ